MPAACPEFRATVFYRQLGRSSDRRTATNHSAPWGPPPTFTADEQAPSNAMIGYWTRFAKTGNPNSAGAPTWSQYGAGGSFESLVAPAPVPESDASFSAQAVEAQPAAAQSLYLAATVRQERGCYATAGIDGTAMFGRPMGTAQSCDPLKFLGLRVSLPTVNCVGALVASTSTERSQNDDGSVRKRASRLSGNGHTRRLWPVRREKQRKKSAQAIEALSPISVWGP